MVPLRCRPRAGPPDPGTRPHPAPQTCGTGQNRPRCLCVGSGGCVLRAMAARTGSVPGSRCRGSPARTGPGGHRPAAPALLRPGGPGEKPRSSSSPARAESGDCPSGLLKAHHVRPFQVLGSRPHTGLTASPVGQYVFNMRAYLMFIDRATIGIILLYVPVTRFNIIILHAILVFISRH